MRAEINTLLFIIENHVRFDLIFIKAQSKAAKFFVTLSLDELL